MRLVVVGFAASVHVARCLQLLVDTGWDVHLFDSQLEPHPHPELPPVTLHPAVPCDPPPGSGVRVAAPPADADRGFDGRVEHLLAVLDDVRPDVVHSHELQHAGALVAGARRRRNGGLGAPWVVTNWGSDVYWWGRVRTRAPFIRSVLGACDWYGAECHRDVALARAFGFRGRVMGVWPVAGGIDVDQAAALRAPGPTSARRAIALKGVAGAIGCAEVALAAIERCRDLLDGWELCVYQANDAFTEQSAAIAETVGMRCTRLSGPAANESAHEDVLAMHGRARVSIGLNRTDALSTSFLEAVAMGAFPVQSRSSCGAELTPPGRGALFVRPSDVDEVAAALRRALVDDTLVDDGAALNERLAREHLDRRRTRARMVDAYERIAVDAMVEAA
ncbi:MAG TPA: glycosyltransferase [Conexibacter sp.]|jgi:hypothetical protein|nr:glycosyltransferase [Conexibacter sp.]